jgi:hypothetical protein
MQQNVAALHTYSTINARVIARVITYFSGLCLRRRFPKFKADNLKLTHFFVAATFECLLILQVYLRIRDEEWNIYRRYSDFYALHADLRKREALVDAFYFPPKKSVGYKAEKVVEERRKRLQDYLRQIVNLLVQTNPALAARDGKTDSQNCSKYAYTNCFLPSADSKAVCRRPRKHFLTPPSLPPYPPFRHH